MKKNQQKIKTLLREILTTCEHDSALQEIRPEFYRLLHKIDSITAKKQNNQSALEQYRKKAEENHKQWLEALKKGIQTEDN